MTAVGAQAAQMICPACSGRFEGGATFCTRDGTQLVRDPNAGKVDRVGQVLDDRYRLVRLIGEGGMGQVYEAEHINLSKRFAVKLLRPEIVSNPEAVRRFRQEARSASSIGDQHIIEISDFAQLSDGSVYLAMEFLEGSSLSDRMKQPSGLPLGDALDIFIQVSKGLGAAHSKGIIHRDMKPENIFLTRRDDRTLAKILDFGIAKVSSAEISQLTQTGAIFGTPHYMSPEQALGKSLDLRTDIYSVGVMMYEVFTGRVPFEADSFMGILTKHITAVPTPPSVIAPEKHIAPELEAVILKAMSKEPSERYANMQALTDALYGVASALAPKLLATPSAPRNTHIPTSTPAPVQKATVPNLPANATPDTLDELPTTKRSPAIFIIGALVIAGVAGAAVMMTKKDPASTKTATTTPSPSPVAVASPSPVAVPSPSPAIAVEKVQIIVDSEPGNADIELDGKVIGKTPDVVHVEANRAVDVMLRKSGFEPQRVTVDARGGRKMLVRLVREKSASSTTVKLPAPPPPAPTTTTATPSPSPVAVTQPPPPAPSPSPVAVRPGAIAPQPPPPQPTTGPYGPARPAPGQIAKRRRPDAYQRLDETPRTKSPDVLDPY